MQIKLTYILLSIIFIILCFALLFLATLKYIFIPELEIPIIKAEPNISEPNGSESLNSSEIIFDFSFDSCDQGMNPYDETNLGVKEINWLDKTSLEIKAQVRINCAEDIVAGNYNLDNNQLTLKYSVSGCDPCAECLCLHRLSYSFQNIKQEQYQVELIKE